MRYERLSVQNRRFRSNGGRLTPTFQVEGVAPTNHSFFQKTRLDDLSYGIKNLDYFSSVLSQFMRLTDKVGRTDGQNLIARLRLRSMSAVKWLIKDKRIHAYYTESSKISAMLMLKGKINDARRTQKTELD